MKTLMIYGASGYTGRMAAAHAKEAGLKLILAGRDEAPLQALATRLDVECRVFALDAAGDVDYGLRDITVLLNCAGPFAHTAAALMEACLRGGVHYLDIAAELDSYQLAERHDVGAAEAGVMLMPGSGGSVAMLGSLAARAVERVPSPVSIRIALHVAGSMSRGSALSASQHVTAQCLMRKDDVLTPRAPDTLRDLDFGKGPLSCFPVTLPDLITIARQTGVGNIETYVHVSGSGFAETIADTRITFIDPATPAPRQGIHAMSLHLNASDTLHDTHAVVDTLYRFAAGIDLRDRALLSSAFAEDAISDFRPAGTKAGFEYPVLHGRETIVEALSTSLSGLGTTHSFSNPRVVVDGDTARVDVLVEAQHVSGVDGARQYLMKNRYDVVLARRDAGWEIKHVIVDNVWRKGDPSVLAGI